MGNAITSSGGGKWWRTCFGVMLALSRRKFRSLRRRLDRERNRFNRLEFDLRRQLADAEQRLRQQEADSRWDKDRLQGQLAIMEEQLRLYVDIVSRERARVAAETAGIARREREARYSSTAGAALLTE